jgi:hypothetical protein
MDIIDSYGFVLDRGLTTQPFDAVRRLSALRLSLSIHWSSLSTPAI